MTPPTLPPLRPRSATEVVDAAIQLVRGHFGHLLQVAALGTIPSLALVLAQAIVAPGAALSADPARNAPLFAFLAASLVVSTIFGFATQGALSWSGLAALQGTPLPSVGEAFRVGFRRLPALVAAIILVGLATVAAMFPLFLVFGAATLALGANAAIAIGLVGIALLLFGLVLMIFVYGLLALVTSLVVLEGLGAVAAIRRSLRLARGSWLRIAGIWLIAIVLFVAVFGTAFAIAASLGNDDVANAIATVLAIPAVPIFGMVALVQYADLRTRREGADLEAALGDALAPGAAGSLPTA